MKIALSWLERFISLEGQTAETIAERLTHSGLEVEGIETYEEIPGNMEGLVIGEVKTCGQHPNADKLSVTTVDIGTDSPAHIVCGAPNVAAGQKVVVATIGTTLYPTEGEPLKIKKGKIRGEVSEGMICAEDEIGLGTSHDGILVLDTDLPNGTPAAQLFKPESDKVLEIGLTPNRADAASHWGTARDLRVLLKRELQKPDVSQFTTQNTDLSIPVEVKNTEACPRYSAVSIAGVTVKDSPRWLQNHLKAIGLKPINNVVDITNFVLHGLGQPLHAFDADQIKGGKVIVQTLPEGTPFLCLDEEERKLTAQDLMICDGEGNPLCIGGVFGGLHSGISEGSKNVFLESAYFSPEYIRRSSNHHQLKTDAAYRFARGTDPNITVFALKYAALLIQELAGGTISSEIVDEYPQPVPHFEFSVKWAYLNKVIGKEIPRSEIRDTLTALEINILEENETTFTVSVPPYRVDVTRPADIAEEVLRIHGFNQIELSEHLQTDYVASFPRVDSSRLRTDLSQFLSGNGWNEIMTNSLTSSRLTAEVPGLDKAAEVPMLNALSEDLDVMRQTPIFGGLEVIRHNSNRQNPDLRLFEFAKTYHKTAGGYTENDTLALYLTGKRRPTSWQESSQEVNFYDLSQTVQLIAQRFGHDLSQAKETNEGVWQYGMSVAGKDGKPLVTWGLLRKKLSKLVEVSEEVFYAEFDWQQLIPSEQPRILNEELPRFPAVSRDLSLVVGKSVSFAQIQEVAQKTERKLLQDIQVFDVFEDEEKLGANKKAYAMTFRLQDTKKTLKDKAIDKTMQRLIQAFEQELNAVIRK